MTGLPAPLVDEVEPVVVAAAVDDADLDVPVAVEVPVPVAVLVAADVPPMGAVDWPLISACSVELNVPVIPVKLIEKITSGRINKKEGNITYVNRAEKASALY